MTAAFITFEGGEGSGKTTQIGRLRAALEAHGVDVHLTREPGGEEEAERIRGLLLEGAGDRWHPLSEMLLFQAARVQHVERVIRPALARGAVVLCDRFADSTFVYQGMVKGLGLEYTRRLHRMTLGNFMPDLTFLLDLDPEAGLERAGARKGKETRFEDLEKTFHQRVRERFLTLARAEPARFNVLDATLGESEIHAQVMAAANQRLPARRAS